MYTMFAGEDARNMRCRTDPLGSDCFDKTEFILMIEKMESSLFNPALNFARIMLSLSRSMRMKFSFLTFGQTVGLSSRKWHAIYFIGLVRHIYCSSDCINNVSAPPVIQYGHHGRQLSSVSVEYLMRNTLSSRFAFSVVYWGVRSSKMTAKAVIFPSIISRTRWLINQIFSAAYPGWLEKVPFNNQYHRSSKMAILEFFSANYLTNALLLIDPVPHGWWLL
jgi:hypothetical protein